MRLCTRARARSVIFRVVLVAGGSRAALGRQLTVAPRRWGQIWPCPPPRRVRTSAAPSQRGFQVAQSQYLLHHHHHHCHHRHHHHHHGGSRRISGSRPAAAAAADHQLANYQGVVRAAGSHRLVLGGGGSGLRVIVVGGHAAAPSISWGMTMRGLPAFSCAMLCNADVRQHILQTTGLLLNQQSQPRAPTVARCSGLEVSHCRSVVVPARMEPLFSPASAGTRPALSETLPPNHCGCGCESLAAVHWWYDGR